MDVESIPIVLKLVDHQNVLLLFCFFIIFLKHRCQGYIAGKSDLLTLDVKKLSRKFCSLASFADIIYLGGDDQFPPETLPHRCSVQSMRHSMAVSLISSRLTNHR